MQSSASKKADKIFNEILGTINAMKSSDYDAFMTRLAELQNQLDDEENNEEP